MDNLYFFSYVTFYYFSSGYSDECMTKKLSVCLKNVPDVLCYSKVLLFSFCIGGVCANGYVTKGCLVNKCNRT